jgi:hypothetical protein
MIDGFASGVAGAVKDGLNALKSGIGEGMEGMFRIFGSFGSVISAIILGYILYRFIRRSGFGIWALLLLGYMIFFIVGAWWLFNGLSTD